MPDKAPPERDFAVFKADLTDVLDCNIAQINRKEGIIYT